MRAMVAAGLICVTGAAGAEDTGYFVSGHTLWGYCNQNPAAARAYTVGVFDGYSGAYGWTNRQELRICLPQGATMEQVHDVACKHLGSHPELRHHAAVPLIAMALQSAFPCPPG